MAEAVVNLIVVGLLAGGYVVYRRHCRQQDLEWLRERFSARRSQEPPATISRPGAAAAKARQPQVGNRAAG